MRMQHPLGLGRLHWLLCERAPLVVRAQCMPPDWLSEGERARLTTLRHPGRRAEFLACRFALRYLLAAAYGTAVDYWRLDAPSGRAPCLDAKHHGMQAAQSTYLSLSHSDDWLACAVAQYPVGIDLEIRDLHNSARLGDPLLLASIACTPTETAQMQALQSKGAQQRYFMRLWSMKEAYFKCLGTGVNFSAIRSIECRPEELASQGLVLARARSLQGALVDGRVAALSVCVRNSEIALDGCPLVNGMAVTWRKEDSCHLVSLVD